MARKGTVRIFLIPFNDQANKPFQFNGSREKAIEVDRFVVNRK